MNKQASDPQKVQASLQKSVAKALERKRRLGQYAVVWRNGRPVHIKPGMAEYRVEDTNDSLVYRNRRDQDATGPDSK